MISTLQKFENYNIIKIKSSISQYLIVKFVPLSAGGLSVNHVYELPTIKRIGCDNQFHLLPK